MAATPTPHLPLLKAIGVWRLAGYFEFLDELRESGRTNMFGAGSALRKEYEGMSSQEAYAVLSAWMSEDLTLPPEDRAIKIIDSAK